MTIKKIKHKFIFLAIFWLFSVLAAQAVAPDKLIVLKNGDNIYIRSYFSPDQDVVIALYKGVNRQIDFKGTALVKNTESLQSSLGYWKGLVFHSDGDESVPWHINGSYIGANHGMYGVLSLTAEKHGLKTLDIGSEWLDANGTKFYLVKIINPDSVWMLSENQGGKDIWKFQEKISGDFLRRDNGDKLKFSKVTLTQLTPSCRIEKQEYMIDGKEPLKESQIRECYYLDIVESYDIIAPDAVLAAIKKNPGKEQDFTAKELAFVINNNILYRFQPRGACTVTHNCKANRSFELSSMGFVQALPLRKSQFDIHDYYIPKTLPFKKYGLQYDFINIQDFSGKLPGQLLFSKIEKNISNPADPPDRFIQFLGKMEAGKIKRKIGFAVGYSLIEGMTRPVERAEKTTAFHYIYTSKKSYPKVIESRRGIISAGTEFYSIAYRQFFDPSDASKNATSVYWHRQKDAYVLYADYHKPIENDVIKVPTAWAGKTFTVIEKTPSIELISNRKISPEGIVISNKADYGYIVLKLDD